MRKPQPSDHAQFVHAFVHSLHGVFLVGAAIAVVPLVLSCLLSEVPLRMSHHVEEDIDVLSPVSEP